MRKFICPKFIAKLFCQSLDCERSTLGVATYDVDDAGEPESNADGQ